MNALVKLSFNTEDWQQFAQLIGYSVSGYGDLSYVGSEACQIADMMASGAFVDERDTRILYLRNLVDALRMQLREPMALLFEKHPDDLHRLDP